MQIRANATALTIVFLFGVAVNSRANDVAPVIAPTNTPSGDIDVDLHVEWGHLIQQALMFTVIQHSFRYATEKDTRHPGVPFFPGYTRAIEGMHGWSDGDPFYVNYVGHPLQGAVAARIWMQNDPKYRDVEIGRDSRYWKSRLRATAFAWVQSVQFEIGPLSEASFGSIQKRWPEQGFVDHVITPSVGLAWVLAEDALDKYFVRKVERNHRILGILLRGGLSPSASFANVLAGKYPWHRQDRTDYPWRYSAAELAASRKEKTPRLETHPEVAPFELGFLANVAIPNDSNLCIGGGGTPAIRVLRTLQIAGEIGGCTIGGLEANLSGDSLYYMVGPRWTPRPAARWSPFMQILVGGQKITQQKVLPEKRAVAIERAKEEGRRPGSLDALEYLVNWSENRFAWKAGVGLDLKLNSAFALRLASVDYVVSQTHLWDGRPYGNGFQLTSGIVLRMGTW